MDHGTHDHDAVCLVSQPYRFSMGIPGAGLQAGRLSIAHFGDAHESAPNDRWAVSKQLSFYSAPHLTARLRYCTVPPPLETFLLPALQTT